MKKLLWLTGACVSAMLVASCSSDGCLNNRNSILLAGFYQLGTEAQVYVTKMSVYGIGAPNDSTLLDTTRNAQQVYLPLRSDTTVTSFVFDAGTLRDTLTIDYSSYPYFDGEDCGAMWRYEIHNVTYTRQFIDSVLVTDPLITNIERERMMIFLTVPETTADDSSADEDDVDDETESDETDTEE